MSTWLGIDTSTDVCVGLAVDGVIVASDLLADRRAHAEQLMPMIVTLCEAAGVGLDQLDGVAVGIGPGPFTGLRVGVATAHVIGAVTGAIVRGVCSLDVVAAQWASSGAPDEFVAVSDARRKEVYWARYDQTGTRLAGPFVTTPIEVPELPACGPGALLLPARSSNRSQDGSPSLPTGGGADLSSESSRPVPPPGAPSALDGGVLAQLGPTAADVGLTPLYLRRPDAEVPTRHKSTLLQPRLTIGRQR